MTRTPFRHCLDMFNAGRPVHEIKVALHQMTQDEFERRMVMAWFVDPTQEAVAA